MDKLPAPCIAAIWIPKLHAANPFIVVWLIMEFEDISIKNTLPITVGQAGVLADRGGNDRIYLYKIWSSIFQPILQALND